MYQLKALLLAAGLFASVAAWAEQSGIDRYLNAGQSFERLAAEAASRGTAPRLSDPEVAGILVVLGDDTVLRARSFKVQDLNLLLDVCGKANSANMTYSLFRKDRVGDSPTQMGSQIRELVDANTVKYQDEIFLLTPFLVRCMSTQTPLMTSFYEALSPEARTEARTQGLLGFRAGVVNLYVGALTSLLNTRIAENLRARLLTSITETASTYAAAIPVARRGEIAQLANAISEQSPAAFRPQLQRVRAAMSEPGCATLCRL